MLIGAYKYIFIYTCLTRSHYNTMTTAIVLLSCLTGILSVIQVSAQQAPGRANSTHSFSVELVVVLDKMAFEKWYNKTPGPTPDDRNKITIKRVTDFITAIVVGMNTLYSSISSFGFSVDIRLRKLLILKTDVWDITALRPGFRDQIPTNKAIDVFYEWSWRSRETLKPFDHAVLITGYNLIDSTDPDKQITGVAYKKVICKYGSVSVLENTFTYQMVDTAAHELGHSLGANHDGEENLCENSRGYIMSSRTEINSTDRWSFSQCSADAIKKIINDLDLAKVNCLRHTKTKPTTGQELGSLFSVDEQCRLAMGPEGFFCRDFYDSPETYSKMCMSIWCSASLSAPGCQNHIASDGFLCGNKKVCRRGACVYDESATETSDTCPQGEHPGVVFQNLTCTEVGNVFPWLCYVDLFYRKCCKTCPAIKQDVPGCEYGDKEPWCVNIKYPYDCYLNDKICCKSCHAHRREGSDGCDYGDKSYECTTKLSLPMGCYKNDKLCCETCAKYKSEENPSCPYGDKSAYCKEKLKVPKECLAKRDLCCDTCKAYANVTAPPPPAIAKSSNSKTARPESSRVSSRTDSSRSGVPDRRRTGTTTVKNNTTRLGVKKVEPVTTTLKPTTITPKPVAAKLQPATTTLKPKATTLQPAATTLKPDSTTLQLDTTTLKPEATTLQPETTTLKPDSTTMQPATTTQKPEATTLQLESTTLKPDSTALQPAITTQKPEAMALQLESTTLKPDSTTLTRDTTTLKPVITTLQLDTTKSASITTLQADNTPVYVTTIQSNKATEGVAMAQETKAAADVTTIEPNEATKGVAMAHASNAAAEVTTVQSKKATEGVAVAQSSKAEVTTIKMNEATEGLTTVQAVKTSEDSATKKPDDTATEEGNNNLPDDSTNEGSDIDYDAGEPECWNGDSYPEFCEKVAAYQCYNSTVNEMCCRTCASFRNTSHPDCEYGDKDKRCQTLTFPYSCYNPTLLQTCCWTCGLYLNEDRADCPYGDRKSWCHSLKKRYKNDQWCPLDLGKGLCCGTCLYNQTAVPALGSTIIAKGVPKSL